MNENIIELTKGSLESIKENNEIVVIKAWAAWCTPCKALTPIFEEVVNEVKNSTLAKHKFVFLSLDTDNLPEITEELQIRSIPSILFFKNGELLSGETIFGAVPKETLKERIKKVLEIKVKTKKIQKKKPKKEQPIDYKKFDVVIDKVSKMRNELKKLVPEATKYVQELKNAENFKPSMISNTGVVAKCFNCENVTTEATQLGKPKRHQYCIFYKEWCVFCVCYCNVR